MWSRICVCEQFHRKPFDSNRNDEFYEFHVVSPNFPRNCCSVLCTRAHSAQRRRDDGRLRCGCTNVMIIVKLKSVIKIDNEIFLISSEREVEINAPPTCSTSTRKVGMESFCLSIIKYEHKNALIIQGRLSYRFSLFLFYFLCCIVKLWR